MISMQGSYFSLDLVNSFLALLDRCQLGDKCIATRSGEPTFADAVLEFPLPEFSHEE